MRDHTLALATSAAPPAISYQQYHRETNVLIPFVD